MPGDRARHLADGAIELLGRDSVTINSGGEKIFAEEVETAIASHPAVADVVVAGRPSERWGQEVVAVVALTDGATVDADELIAHAATSWPLQTAEGGGVPARHRAQSRRARPTTGGPASRPVPQLFGCSLAAPCAFSRLFVRRRASRSERSA